MDLTFLVDFVEKYGYWSMFLFNWLLIFGLPVPNEVAAAFSGMLTEISYFHPVTAFIAAYGGLITSTTFAYGIGKFFGSRLLPKLQKTFLNNTIEKFILFLNNRGKWAISLSFFLPGVRWAMPFVVGASGFSFKTFSIFAYSAGFVWMLIYFNIGRTFPYAYEVIIDHLQPFLISVSCALVVVLIIFLIRKHD